MINHEKNKPIKLKNMLAYGGGDFFGGGSFAVLGLWLMFFYTTYAGLSPVCKRAQLLLLLAYWMLFLIHLWVISLITFIAHDLGRDLAEGGSSSCLADHW